MKYSARDDFSNQIKRTKLGSAHDIISKLLMNLPVFDTFRLQTNYGLWVRLGMLFILSTKLGFVFERCLCLLGLIATRYLAQRTDEGRVYACEEFYHTKQITRSESSNESTKMNSARSSAIIDSFSGIFQDQKNITSVAHTLHDFAEPESPCQSMDIQVAQSALPSSYEEESDEWGHFTDFQDYSMDKSYENTSSGDAILADPFQSLNKSVRRIRGDKLSMCKLEQLEEEDELDFE
jgi:hypothetical protein